MFVELGDLCSDADHKVRSARQALANHGLIPRDGRKVRPSQLAAALGRAYNLSPTIAYQLLAPMYHIWEGRDWFDLHDIAVPGLIAHDGSFTVSPARMHPPRNTAIPDSLSRHPSHPGGSRSARTCTRPGHTITRS